MNSVKGVSVGGELGVGKLLEMGVKKSDAGVGFSSTLSKAMTEVNQLQKEADLKIQKLSTGESNNIHDTMIAVEKADIALKLMMRVRNKIIDAYQEVMRMQV